MFPALEALSSVRSTFEKLTLFILPARFRWGVFVCRLAPFICLADFMIGSWLPNSRSPTVRGNTTLFQLTSSFRAGLEHRLSFLITRVANCTSSYRGVICGRATIHDSVAFWPWGASWVLVCTFTVVAWEQAPFWGIERKTKSASEVSLPRHIRSL